MSNTLIPNEIIAFLSGELSRLNSHEELNTLFLFVNVSDDIPKENKEKKVRRRLQYINNNDPEPIKKLEILLNKFIGTSINNNCLYEYEKAQADRKKQFKENVESELSKFGFTYINGKILPSKSLSPASITLLELIKNKDVESINREFDRALQSLKANPLDAISSACNILESILKMYISEKGLTMPNTQVLRELWKVVKNNFRVGLNKLSHEDLQKINSGLISIIDGISGMRTHASSAHGYDKEFCSPDTGYARLVINAAHSLAVFILEKWDSNDQ